MLSDLFQLYVHRWQFFLTLTLQHLEISLIAIIAAITLSRALSIMITGAWPPNQRQQLITN